MPKKSGVSDEFLNARLDEIAQFNRAQDQLAALTQLAGLLYERQKITEAYYRDIIDATAYIGNALLIGKRNTAHWMRQQKG